MKGTLIKTSNRSRKKKSPLKEAAAIHQNTEEELKVEKLKEEMLFKALPKDLQWEILSEYLGTHVVRNGKLMRKMTGEIQSRLLDSMPQMMRGRKPLQLNLKTAPIQYTNSSWYKHFDHPGKQGSRALAVVEDSNGNPSYRYVSMIDGQDDDRVEIITPINNSTVLEPYKKNNYPSYPFTDKKLGYNLTRKKSKKFNPTKPNTGYNPR